MHAGRNKISSEIKFWIIAFIWTIIYSVYSIWARGFCPQGMSKEPDFFYHNSGMPNSMRPFPIQNFMLLIIHLLILVNEISLYITICSSGLILLNTFAHCCTNELSDLGISLNYLNYLNYAKNSSCRQLCIKALVIHHIIFSTVSTVSMNLVKNQKIGFAIGFTEISILRLFKTAWFQGSTQNTLYAILCWVSEQNEQVHSENFFFFAWRTDFFSFFIYVLCYIFCFPRSVSNMPLRNILHTECAEYKPRS